MKTYFSIFLAALTLQLTGCKKDENDPENPDPTNNEELITTVTLHAQASGNSSNTSTASFRDVDGAGGVDATLDTLFLDTNTTYSVSVELLDESGSQVEDITVEVINEADEHLFCYEASAGLVAITLTDTDGELPLGVESEWITTAAMQGEVKVTLKHQPDGQKYGSCDPGETDVEVVFPVVVR